jgi:polyphenol oxidase
MIEHHDLRSILLKRAGIRHEFARRADSVAPQDLATAKQVHGVGVIWPSGPGASSVEADVLAARRGVAVGVFTADCVPLLIGTSDASMGAAVHAGWRGTIGGSCAAAVRALEAAGARPGDLIAAIGPAVGPCCYEVSAELAARFAERFGTKVSAREQGRTIVDLQLANAVALEELGVAAGHIEVLRRCTRCARNESGEFQFHSFRRDGAAAGRQISYLAL